MSHGETGLLVPPGEAEPFARALVELGSDLGRAKRMGDAGRERAMGKFQEHFCTDRTELLYREALGDATAALEAAALPAA